MTNQEVISGLISTDISVIRANCILIGLNPDQTYVATNKCGVYEVAIKCLIKDMNGIKSVREGSMSIEYKSDNLNQNIRTLAIESDCQSLIAKYGDYGSDNIVQDKSNLW